MKKLLLSFAILAFTISCNGKKTEEHGHDHNDGTHQHTESEAHSGEVKQEEFTVGDTTSTHSQEHQHTEGEPHQH